MDDRAHRMSSLARELLRRADTLHASVYSAQQDEATREADSVLPPADPLEKSSSKRSMAMEQRVSAADTKLLVENEVAALRKKVKMQQARLKAMATGRTPPPAAPAPAKRRPPQTAKAIDEKQLSELRRANMELRRAEMEVTALRERELALVGVLSTFKKPSQNEGGHGRAETGRKRHP